MKKKAVVLFAGLLACSAMLGGCGGNQASNDYVKVGGYKGIEVDKVEDKQEVSDEDVDNYIQAVRQQNMAEAEGAAAEDGDTVNIDFVGKMDGQEFEGGSARDRKLPSDQEVLLMDSKTASSAIKQGKLTTGTVSSRIPMRRSRNMPENLLHLQLQSTPLCVCRN